MDFQFCRKYTEWNFWNIKQGMTTVPGKLANGNMAPVNRRPVESFSGTAPALTQMSRASRGKKEPW